MLSILIAASPGTGMATTLLPVVEAFLDRGHRIVVLAEEESRTRFERLGARFVAVDTPRRSPQPERRALIPGVEQMDAVLRSRLLEPLRVQWDIVQRTIRLESVDVIVTDPAFLGAAAVAQLPRHDRPAVIALGAFPLPLSDPDVPPYGLGMAPRGGESNRLRNVVLQAVIHRLLLRTITRDVKRAMKDLTGVDMEGPLTDAPRYADAWAQLTIPQFEYPRSKRHPNLSFVGPLRPLEQGLLPEWWDYADPRPMINVHHTAGGRLDGLVIPAIDALRDCEALVVVTGTDLDSLKAEYGWTLPENLRVAREIPNSHLRGTTRVLVTTGDYEQVHHALRWGIPLVVTGMAEEQVETNARVGWSGVGISLRTRSPTVESIRTAVLHALHDEDMRSAAARLAAQVARTDAERALCDIAEGLAYQVERRKGDV